MEDWLDGRDALDAAAAEDLLQDAFASSKLKLAPNLRRALAALLLEEATCNADDKDARVSREQFEQLAKQYPSVVAVMEEAAAKARADDGGAAARGSAQDKKRDKKQRSAVWRAWHWVSESLWFFVALTLWVCGMAGFFIWGWTEISTRTAPTPEMVGYTGNAAKGLARVTEISAMGAMFYMLKSVTVLKFLMQIRPIRYLLGLDYALELHRILASVFFAAGFIHGLLWLGANYPRLMSQSRWNDVVCGNSDTTCSGATATNAWDLYGNYQSWSGYFLMLLCVLFILSIAVPLISLRRAPKSIFARYKYFIVSHYCFALVVLIMFMLHPLPGFFYSPGRSTAWVFMCIPVTFWLIALQKRVFMQFKPKRLQQKAELKSVMLLPGPWMVISMTKPKNVYTRRPFNAKPGQYASIHIPSVSRVEWHPFTIASAPQDELVTFHIKAFSNSNGWTSRLHSKLQKLAGSSKALGGAGSVSASNGKERTHAGAAGGQPTDCVVDVGTGDAIRREAPATSDAALGKGEHAAVSGGTAPRMMRIDTLEVFGADDAGDDAGDGAGGGAAKDAVDDSSALAPAMATTLRAPHATPAPEQQLQMPPTITAPTITVLLDGPFASPLQDPILSSLVNGVVFTAGGVGITPFLSLVKCYSSLDTLPKHLTGQITLLWAEREQHVARVAQDVWDAVDASPFRDRFDCHLFLTATGGATMRQRLWLRLAQELGQKHWGLDPITLVKGRAVNVRFGRPNWEAELRRAGAHQPPGNSRIQVLFCGSAGLGSTIKQACMRASEYVGPASMPESMRSKFVRQQSDAGHCHFTFLQEKIG